MKLEFNDYLVLNREGIFPGPGETPEDFASRVSQLSAPIGLPGEALIERDWDVVHSLTQHLFDIQPTWIPAFYWNKKISFWEAAAAWDFEGRAVIQLRKQLAKGSWFFVDKKEVLAHEAAHAARVSFFTNRFEEIICYQTSSSSWRRRFGPLFRTPWEASFCISSLLVGWGCSLMGMLLVGLAIPWITLFFFFLRLLYDQYLFWRCVHNIRSLLIDPNRALAVMLRLTDAEIELFSRASREQIFIYLCKQRDQELRWKIIYTAYFSV